MKYCDLCGSQYPEELTRCPNCSRRVGMVLSRPVGAPDTMAEVARQTLARLRSRWGFHMFASGWRIAEVVLRVVLIVGLVWLILSSAIRIENDYHRVKSQLASHDEFIRERLSEVRKRNLLRAEVSEAMTNYQRLSESTAMLVEAQHIDARLHVVVLLGLLVLIVVELLARYRLHKELNRVRATVEFLCTPEGREWAERQKSG